MRRNVLSFMKNFNNQYMAIFRTNHGRHIYLGISVISDGFCTINECHYLDRTKGSTPKKLVTSVCELSFLLDVIKGELDKDFGDVIFADTAMSKEDYISLYFSNCKKKILIMIAENYTLRTIFKSKYRREIYLEVTVDENNVATITQCYYVDKRAKGLKIPPQGIVTVRFEFSLNQLLRVINEELEGGFTDAIITREHTIVLDRAICGSI